MVDIRKTIVTRLSELGWTRYKLAKLMHPHLSKQGVYQYLGGRNDMSGQNLQRVFGLLGLAVTSDGLVEKPCVKSSSAKSRPKKQAKSRRRRKD